MLDPPVAVCTQAVETQAVSGKIDLPEQARAQHRPLCRIDLALEDRILNSLAKIETCTRVATQTPSALSRRGADIVADEHQHRLYR